MEGTDVVASVIAILTATWNGRDGDDRCGRRNDGSVGAILEHDAVTTVIVGVVGLEGRGVEWVILSCIANSASLLSLLARSGTHLLLASTLRLLMAAFIVSSPVVPPGLVNVASGSFTANLEIAAICDDNRSGWSNVTRRNRNFWNSNIINWSYWGFRDHCLIANHCGMRNAFLLAREPASPIVSSDVALAWVIAATVLGRLIFEVLDTTSLPIEILFPIVGALGNRSIISNCDHSYAINVLDLALVIHARCCCCLVSHESGSTGESASWQ